MSDQELEDMRHEPHIAAADTYYESLATVTDEGEWYYGDDE